MSSYQYSDLTEKIIECFYTVYRVLGYGFLERVYENALKIELEKQGFGVEQQIPIEVNHLGEVVGDYYADLIVEDSVILELKAQDTLNAANSAQLLNYLKATKYEVGLLLNFGKKPEVKRKVFSNDRK